LKLVDGLNTPLYQTESQAGADVQKAFVRADLNQQVIMLSDLSLHFISDGERKWTREECLSQVTQVEVFDQNNIIHEDIASDADSLSYIPKMGDSDVPLSEIPSRILARYRDNFKFLLASGR
jgi:hypothetical protein